MSFFLYFQSRFKNVSFLNLNFVLSSPTDVAPSTGRVEYSCKTVGYKEFVEDNFIRFSSLPSEVCADLEAPHLFVTETGFTGM